MYICSSDRNLNIKQNVWGSGDDQIKVTAKNAHGSDWLQCSSPDCCHEIGAIKCIIGKIE
jgi:hypothetical protein